MGTLGIPPSLLAGGATRDPGAGKQVQPSPQTVAFCLQAGTLAPGREGLTLSCWETSRRDF